MRKKKSCQNHFSLFVHSIDAVILKGFWQFSFLYFSSEINRIKHDILSHFQLNFGIFSKPISKIEWNCFQLFVNSLYYPFHGKIHRKSIEKYSDSEEKKNILTLKDKWLWDRRENDQTIYIWENGNQLFHPSNVLGSIDTTKEDKTTTTMYLKIGFQCYTGFYKSNLNINISK